MLKPLPVSSATFRKIIEGDALYVDKTRDIYELIQHPTAIYFLSRPRRFGKSLTISILDEIFQGNRDLFEGLWIHEETDYDWQVYPVIRIDFSTPRVETAATLKEAIDYKLQLIARAHEIQLLGFDYQTRFQDLIYQLGQKQRVVILIDVYDKPILDNIDNPEAVRNIRDVLKAFYAVIKAMDAHIRFVFITGITKFSKVGIFTELNNLSDITMDTRFATMFGLTQAELESQFSEHITAFAEQEKLSGDRLLEQIRIWYNGFRFSWRGEAVYNPFSIVLLFNTQYFANFWFESGTPTFLIKLIHENNYNIPQLEELKRTELAFR